MSIDEILNRIAEHLRSDFGELIDGLNRRVEDLQDKVETLEAQNRDKDKQISKLDKFVKTLVTPAPTPLDLSCFNRPYATTAVLPRSNSEVDVYELISRFEKSVSDMKQILGKDH